MSPALTFKFTNEVGSVFYSYLAHNCGLEKSPITPRNDIINRGWSFIAILLAKKSLLVRLHCLDVDGSNYMPLAVFDGFY